MPLLLALICVRTVLLYCCDHAQFQEDFRDHLHDSSASEGAVNVVAVRTLLLDKSKV